MNFMFDSICNLFQKFKSCTACIAKPNSQLVSEEFTYAIVFLPINLQIFLKYHRHRKFLHKVKKVLTAFFNFTLTLIRKILKLPKKSWQWNSVLTITVGTNNVFLWIATNGILIVFYNQFWPYTHCNLFQDILFLESLFKV